MIDVVHKIVDLLILHWITVAFFLYTLSGITLCFVLRNKLQNLVTRDIDVGMQKQIDAEEKKRLQWFYDIVGEKRVKPLLFQSPLVKLFISRTAPVICGLIGIDVATQMISEHQFQVDKRGATQLA